MARRSYAGGAVPTTLSVLINSSVLSMTGAVFTNWPNGSGGLFVATIDRGLTTEEKVLITGISGTTATIAQRGYDGTTGQAHAAGAIIEHTLSAIDLDEANAHVNTAVGVHGIGGGAAVVGTSTTQILTNKTLTSPIFNGSGGAVTLPPGPDTLVGRASVDTLTNKTLTTPVINGSGGALALPAGPDTLVGRATTDTLTNKTLTSPTINGGALSGTLSGAVALSGAVSVTSGSLTVGSGSASSPFFAISDNGTVFNFIQFIRNNFLRWYLGADGANNFNLARYDAAGTFQNFIFTTASATGAIDFPNVIPTSGSVPLVTTTAAQTLTSKTLTSPTINTATIDAASTHGGVTGTLLAADRAAWTSYTPTYTNLNTVVGTAYYRISGKTLYVRIHVATGNITATAAVTISCPPGVVGPATGKQGIIGPQNGVPTALTLATGATTFSVNDGVALNAGVGFFNNSMFCGTFEIA